MSEFPMRINKYLAHKGYATRRGADTLIADGKVFINSSPALVGQKITEKDVVEVKNDEKTNYRYLLYYKPRGIITHSPGAGETDIVTKLKTDYGITGVFPVGRLDKDSEGLMILSDDGRITERLLNPDQAHEREYEVTVDKKVTGSFLKKLEGGVNIEGYQTKPARAELLRDDVFLLSLTEGKKHQVRRMSAALGYQVQALKRVRIDALILGRLKPNQYKLLKGLEQRKFLKSLGLTQ